MRRITQHRTDESGFDESLHALVRHAPWWMTSLAFHLIVLMILWGITMPVRVDGGTRVMVAEQRDATVAPEEIPPPPPPDIEIETPIETPVTVFEDDDTIEDPTDDPTMRAAGEEGTTEGAFTGAGDNSAIGIGANTGGGPGGPGGRDRKRPRGGLRPTEDSVDLGLRWLADHQDVATDGKWDCDDFGKHDPVADRCDGPGGALYDVGVTGLALLAFLGAGYTDRGDGPFVANVRGGLRYLMSMQDDDGCFGSRSSQHFMYNHAIATLAITEAYWMTRNPRYRKPAQDGLDFISRARNPYLAWRYEPRGGENDTSVTGWMVMALKSGMFAGLAIDPDAFEGARQWVDKMTDPEFGQVGYNMPGGAVARPEGLQDRFPPEKSQAMTAAGILTRIFLGEDPRTSEMIRKGANLCLERLPTWNPDDGSIDMYYWYYATLALFQVGGPPWKKWNESMVPAIVKSQHPRGQGARTGSWDPIDPWGRDGGRVYATACMVMCLEVYYRYDRVVGIR